MSSSDEPAWRFVTNHTRVLLCIAGDGGIRMREIADRVRITERAAQRIVADLVDAGVVEHPAGPAQQLHGQQASAASPPVAVRA